MAQLPGNEVPIDRLRLTTFCRDLRPSDVWRRVWPWGVLWAVTSAVIYVSVVAIDHPLALLIRERTEPTIVATLLVRLPEAIAGTAIVGAAAFGMWRTLIGQLQGMWRSAFLACIGVCVALALKSELKLLFGRVPPDTWFWHQSGPLRNFHLFYAGSFPSGHMTVLGVLIPFVWALAMPLKFSWLLIYGVVGGALLVMEAHFLGDLIAGTLLGVTVGTACLRISRM
jgi:membrane-associated phospholipid phosphatase